MMRAPEYQGVANAKWESFTGLLRARGEEGWRLTGYQTAATDQGVLYTGIMERCSACHGKGVIEVKAGGHVEVYECKNCDSYIIQPRASDMIGTR